jgi:broad specificity phosphatase PhoE
MSIVLIRHGETALNAARVIQPPDTPLSGRGLRQAEALAHRVARLGVAGIVASPLPRAWQTAEAIAGATGWPITPQTLLEERNFGELRGLPYDALGLDALTSGHAPPGGESMIDFETRVAQAFAALLALRATLGGPLAVVTHGLVIRALIARHLALPHGAELPARIANTSITLAAALPPHAVSLLDCTRHLTDELRDDVASLSGG